MLPQWIIICVQFAVHLTGCFGHAFVSRSKYGTISVVEPAFVNREVTLKVTQFYPWERDVEWRYIMENGTTVQTMNGTNVNRYAEDESFFLKWTASAEYNRAQFYADCSTNITIQTQMASLNMKDIDGPCGALALLSPVVLGADVKLGYFPSDQFIQRKTDTNRKWTKNNHEIHLHEGFYTEKRVTEYSYIMTIFNFNKTDEGTYILNCPSHGKTGSIQLHISERPSFPVLGSKYPDFNRTKCIYAYVVSDFYCKTENGTEPVQVTLLIGRDSFDLAENERKRGLYRIHDVLQHMDRLSRRNVTCQVSNAALETPYEVHGTLCSVEKGSRPVLRVPEQLNGENSTTICEVRDSFPAPAIEIRLFEIDPPLDLLMSVNIKHDYNKNGYNCLLNMSCETDSSNPPCTIEWSIDNDNVIYVHSNNWTNGKSWRYRSVSNVLLNVTNEMAGGTITCSTKCDYFPSGLYKDYTLSSSELFLEADIIKESSPKILNLTCHSGEPCIPCAIVWSSNSVYLYPISTSQWTKNSGSGYTTVSNALYFITKDVDGTQIQCSAKCGNESSGSKHENYTISIEAFKESTTNPASVVTQQWHTPVLYALSGTFLLALVTKLTVLLLRRCKPHAYERFLHRRGAVDSDPSRHVYDAVQSSVETAVLHDLRRISASAPENTSPISVIEEHQVCSNKNVCHYDYVDTSSVQQDQRTNPTAGTYIHAI